MIILFTSSAMKIAQRLAITTIQLPPCSLQIFPLNNEIVFIGTYKLEKLSGSRHGSIETYRLKENQFTLLDSTPTSQAILDLKFHPAKPTFLVLAHSSGIVRAWTVDPETYVLESSREYSLSQEDTLVTSIFFNPTDTNMLLCTLTSGAALILDLVSGAQETFDSAHELECWTGAFGQLGPCQNIVFTGGDDSRLIARDIRTKEKVWATDHRHHEAGVVLILCPSDKWLSSRPNDLWTGSYDDCLRTFDVRNISGVDGRPTLFLSLLPMETSKTNLGGGVWRLIPSPDSEQVLACCMYDGARIVRPKGSSIEVGRYFKGDHESMCYGGDWVDTESAVTCSFNDSIVQQWLIMAIE